MLAFDFQPIFLNATSISMLLPYYRRVIYVVFRYPRHYANSKNVKNAEKTATNHH